MTPTRLAERGEERVDLWVEFIERLVDEAAVDAGAAAGDLQLDWAAIRDAAAGTSDAELALGRQVVLADQIIQEWSSARSARARHVVVPAAIGPRAEPEVEQGPASADEPPAPAAASRVPAAVVAPSVLALSVPAPGVCAVVLAPPTPTLDPGPAPRPDALAPAAPARDPGVDARNARRLMLAGVFGWVRNVGIVLLLFAAWNLWGTNIQSAHSQSSLRTEFTSHVHVHPASANGPQLVASSVHLPEPSPGTVMAHLVIPAIGVDQFVVEGTAASDLDKGPGHYIGTALPGQQGNVAIAGHRTTYGAPFNHLDELKVGDKVVLTTSGGQSLTYAVTQPPVAVSPRDVVVLNDAGDNRLTLTTCNPKFYATQRLVVVAVLEQHGTHVHHVPVSRHVVAGSTGWNLRYLPWAFLAIAALVLLGLCFGQFRTRLRGVSWLILVPIWLAGLYLLFVALTGLLPATL